MAEKTVATPEVQKPNRTESTRNQERYVAPPSRYLRDAGWSGGPGRFTRCCERGAGCTR